MRRERSEWWQTRYTGHSTTQMHVVVETLDGGWREKFIVRSILWKVDAKDRQVKLYLRMLEPWRMA